MRFDAQRALIVYAGALTAMLGWLLVTGAAPSTPRFDTIDVRRINLREGDGTLRMVIAARDRFPGLIIRGREHAHPGRTDSAGLLFFNDEGTENGGLIFGGRGAPGGATSFGHLSFDQYEQDQVVALEQSEASGKRTAGLTISDRPSAPLDPELGSKLAALPTAERERTIAAMRARGELGQSRAFIGKHDDGVAAVDLKDASGRPRLRLAVAPGGAARIEFLGADGRVTRTIGG